MWVCCSCVCLSGCVCVCALHNIIFLACCTRTLNGTGLLLLFFLCWLTFISVNFGSIIHIVRVNIGIYARVMFPLYLCLCSHFRFDSLFCAMCHVPLWHRARDLLKYVVSAFKITLSPTRKYIRNFICNTASIHVMYVYMCACDLWASKFSIYY